MIKQGWYWAKIHRDDTKQGWPGYPEGIPNLAYVKRRGQGVTAYIKTADSYSQTVTSYSQPDDDTFAYVNSWFIKKYRPFTKGEAFKFSLQQGISIFKIIDEMNKPV